MRKWTVGISAASAAAIALVLAVAPNARGDVPGLSAFEGEWIYADGRRGIERIDRAVDRAVDGMVFFIRPLARDRVRVRAESFQRLRFAVDGQRLNFGADDWGPVSSRINGPGEPIVGPEGSELRLVQRFRDGRLTQVFRHEDGMRENVFAVSGDGSWLWMHARLSSPRIPNEARFSLRYRRAGDAGPRYSAR